jgi:hypothetical protein
MAGSVLLPRPLRVHARFVRNSYLGAATMFACGLVMSIAFPIWQTGEAKRILADEALWKGGTPAGDASVSGRETSHNFLLNSYHLDVVYTDDHGTEHKAPLEFDTLFSSVDQKAPVDVRYDAKDPTRFALSWAVDLTGARWAAVAFLGLGLGALGLVVIWAGRIVLRRLADARQVGTSFEELELPLVQVIEMRQYGRATGQLRYRYEAPRAGGKARKQEVVFNRKKKQEPLFVDPERTRMLAVRTSQAPDRPIVLRNDFYPFDVSETDRAATLARVDRRRTETH